MSHFTKWSTDALDERDRFPVWNEVVCRSIVDVSTESSDSAFSARIVGWNFGSLRFAAFDCSSHEIVRTGRHISRSPDDCYLISLQLAGRSRITQNSTTITLDPHQIAIFDGQKPFHITFPNEVSRIVAVIPRQMIELRTSSLRRQPLRKMTSISPYFDLARRHMMQLAGGIPDLNESVAGLLCENLCNLLVLENFGDAPSDRLEPELMLDAMLAFCRQNLHDAKLSPSFVAAHFGVSVRTLHLRFRTMGQSFGRWLLGTRLDACRTALQLPYNRNSPISDVAYRFGFNDLSHFNKAFRAHYGMPPGDWKERSQFQ
jgi:AraC family transcriptional activator of tynA and feaB